MRRRRGLERRRTAVEAQGRGSGLLTTRRLGPGAVSRPGCAPLLLTRGAEEMIDPVCSTYMPSLWLRSPPLGICTAWEVTRCDASDGCVPWNSKSALLIHGTEARTEARWSLQWRAECRRASCGAHQQAHRSRRHRLLLGPTKMGQPRSGGREPEGSQR